MIFSYIHIKYFKFINATRLDSPAEIRICVCVGKLLSQDFDCQSDSLFEKPHTTSNGFRMSYLLFPELIDHIFEYLDDRDLYTSLFVSHQFNEHATRLLYRHIRFDAGFTADYSNERHKIQVVTCLGESENRVGIQKAGISLGKLIPETCHCSTHPVLARQSSI